MSESVLRKDQLESSLHNERRLIEAGKLKEDNPLDLSEPFRTLCEACRRGDLKICQEKITEGVNINGRDFYDYTPLILASLCGHYEVVQLLLDSGALCERDTFQGERCLYNALNDRIRNLLLQYDYSKSTDPLQPFAAHLSSLLSREHPQTSDIVVEASEESFRLHKFVLSARSPYFRRKLSAATDTTSFKLPNTIPPQAFSACIKYLYLGEAPRELKSGPGTGFTESDVVAGIDRIGKHLELRSLLDTILESGDRRLARQRRTEEVAKGRDQTEAWFLENVLNYKIVVDADKVNDVKWDRDNAIFADVLLRADEDAEDSSHPDGDPTDTEKEGNRPSSSGIPVGPSAETADTPTRTLPSRKSVLFPVHRAMLLRSEFFLAMFSSGFREAQDSKHLHIISVDCPPEVLEIVLTYLYTEKADFSLEVAVDVLFAADLLLIERLKTKAAVVISTLGNGTMIKPKDVEISHKPQKTTGRTDEEDNEEEEQEEEPLDIYEIIRAGWLTRVQRLEEFAARYLAYRLEAHIDSAEFEQLVVESAQRIQGRQETDSIELVDDIRYYLSERYRLRFEDAGIDEMMEDEADQIAGMQNDVVNIPQSDPSATEADTPKSGAEASSSTPSKTPEDEGVDVSAGGAREKVAVEPNNSATPESSVAVVKTLEGEDAGDEFSRDAMNYQILLNKLDRLLEKLDLDA